MLENTGADSFADTEFLNAMTVDPRDYGGKSSNSAAAPDTDAHADTDTDTAPDTELSELSSEELVADIRRNISCIAFCHARVIALIDEVEVRGLWAQWVGVTSLPQWVMHVAAVSAHTAREYVRVMMALREMPKVKESLGAGDVSFSKVREVTRLVGRIPDEDALRLADVSTGSQIGLVARDYLQLSAANAASTIPQFLPSDRVGMRATEPGRTRITIDLGEDEAAELFTMLDAARHVLERQDIEEDADGEEAEEKFDLTQESKAPAADAVGPADDWGAPVEQTVSEEKRPYEPISQVMCLMEIVRAFPRAESAGMVDADRARMLIHASAEVVTRFGPRAGTAEPTSVVPGSAERPLDDVPAGTDGVEAYEVEGAHDTDDVHDSGAGEAASVKEAATCRIDGFGGVTAETAERLTCEALISGAVKDADGDVLMLGRSRRLVSRRQRLALSARDMGCQFPGCRARWRCDAHHIRPWSQGGATDLDNLILLCRTHHTAVHQYELTISRTAASFAGALEGLAAFVFSLPDGSELLPLERGQSGQHGRQVFDTALLVKVVEEAMAEADPSTVGGGYGFHLDNCIAWMFEAEWRHARAGNAAA